MPYSADAAAVLRWLPEIEADNSNYNEEINTIRTEVARDIDIIARTYTTLPILNDTVKQTLADIEAEWSAGRWRKRRPYATDPQVNQYRFTDYEKEAKMRLQELLAQFYHGHSEFVGTNRTAENSSQFMGP